MRWGIRRNSGIAEGDASIAHQARPFGPLYRAAAKSIAELLRRNTRDVQQFREVKEVLNRFPATGFEASRLKSFQAGARRLAVPRADILADVAAKNVAAHRLAKRFGNRPAKLDRQIRDATA